MLRPFFLFESALFLAIGTVVTSPLLEPVSYTETIGTNTYTALARYIPKREKTKYGTPGFR